MQKTKQSSPLNRSLPPLQIIGSGGGEEHESLMEMQIVEPTTSSTVFTSSFKLPRGWSVEERPRTNSYRSDKYYYEPRTGRQFRSLISIQKYLMGKEDMVSPKRRKCGNVENMQIVPYTTKSAASFGLPDDWIVQEIPRKNINYAGTVDRYYIEPGTGFRFRSRLAAERYLQEERNIYSTTNAREGKQLAKKHISDEELPLKILVKQQKATRKIKAMSKALKLGYRSAHISNSVCRENDVSREVANVSAPNIASPPAKVKWVLGGPRGNIWNALMDESTVPESLKHEWSEMFVFSISENF